MSDEEKQEVEILKEELEDTKEEAEEYKKDLQRLQAEFENYMKRAEKRHEEYKKFAKAELASSLVGVLDDFEKAVEAFKGDGDKELTIKGVEMILKNFKKALGQEGISEIESVGKKFDPNYHEVLSQEESEEDKGIILKEIQKGYLLHDKVLRPAKVIVSGGKQNE